MEQLTRELRHAFRSLRRAPILSTVIVFSLGIGIGVNTVVFSWIQALMFHPLPGVADGASFHAIEPQSESGTRPGTSWLEYQDLRQRLGAMTDLIAFRMVPLNVGEAVRTERTYALLVSGNYFENLGLRPAAGRFIQPEEVIRPGAQPVAVISYDYWQTRFDRSQNALGQTLRANGRDLTIVGVTPAGFQGTVLGLQFDLWVPATLAPTLLAGSRELEDRNQRGYTAMGHLRPDATAEQAQLEVAAAMRDLAAAYPDSNRNMTGELRPFWRALRGPPAFFLQALSILQGVMLLLLLAVCGNTANLVLARATARQREMGVHLAVGAGTWRIVRLLLMENVALGVLASGLGVLIAIWGTQALRAMPLTLGLPVRFQTNIDEVGLVFAVGLGVLCSLVFGAAPAIQLSRVDPQQVLRASASTIVRRGLRNGLMAAQVTLAVAVLMSAGLFLRSFQETRDDPGFERAGLMLAAYDLSGRNLDEQGARDFARQLIERLEALPDVEVASIATSVPLDIHGLPARSFTIEGRARTDGTSDRMLSNTVTPGYFSAMRIRIVAGTDFAELADRSAPAQVIVNEEFVRRYVAEGEVLGRRVENNQKAYVVAGVVRDSLYESYGEPPKPIVYFSYRDRPAWMGEVHVRGRVADETQLTPSIRRVVRDLDESLPIYNVRTMTQHVETNLALRRIPAQMFAVLGPLLLVLAAVGIYAVVAYTVAHRTTEIGVRMALGATTTGVLSQIVRESMRVVVAGAVFGWLIVYLVYSHLVRGPIDPAAFVGVPLLLLLVAMVAAWIPARRASTIDPMAALRHE
jgi:putative ABC transport system permease protein